MRSKCGNFVKLDKDASEVVSKLLLQIEELKTVIAPFAAIAEELLKNDGRLTQAHYKDSDPVYACNSASITIGDCKKLIEVNKSGN